MAGNAKMTLYTLVYSHYFCRMFRKTRTTFLALVGIVLLSGCNEYQKVLKSTDLDYKYAKAIEYYEAGQYARALPIFDELRTLYRGTMRVQDVYYYYCATLYGSEDYILAGYHFKTFAQTFPGHPKAEEASYLTAKCYYLEAPKWSLDQAYTYRAINELQLFINTHPGSEHIIECNELIDELRHKLERKSYEIAYQYYHTRRYQAALTSFANTLNDFPDTPFREEAMFYRLQSAYRLAENSVEDKQLERYRNAKTAYLDFVRAFPNSEFMEDADETHERINEFLNGKSVS